MKPGRTPCCVPFCGRTAPASNGWSEYLCGVHYRLADASLRQRRRFIRARWRKASGWRAERFLRMDERLWERAKRQAIERAAGI